MSASIRDSWSWDEHPADTKGAPANALTRIRRAGWSREFPRRGQNPLAKLCNFWNRQKVRRTHEIISQAVGQHPVTRDPQRTLVQRSRDQRPSRECKSEALFRRRKEAGRVLDAGRSRMPGGLLICLAPNTPRLIAAFDH